MQLPIGRVSELEGGAEKIQVKEEKELIFLKVKNPKRII